MLKNLFEKYVYSADESKEVILKEPPKIEKVTTNIPTPFVDNFSTIDDSKYVELLNQSIAEYSKTVSEFDFMKFVNILNTNSAFIPDEATRYKVAYSTANSISPISVEALENSAKSYIAILSKEQSEFESEVSKFEMENVETRIKRLEDIEKEKIDIQNKIVEMQNKLSQLSDESIQTANQVREIKAEIDTKKNSFNSAMNKISNSLLKYSENLRKYI